MIYYHINCHYNFDGLVTLLSQIYHPDDFFVVAVGGSCSKKDSDALLPLLQYANVRIRNFAPVNWGARTFLDTILDSLEEFIHSGENYTHFINISGDCFPLLDRRSLLERIAENPDVSYVQCDEYDGPYSASDVDLEALERTNAKFFRDFRLTRRDADSVRVDKEDQVLTWPSFNLGDKPDVFLAREVHERSYFTSQQTSAIALYPPIVRRSLHWHDEAALGRAYVEVANKHRRKWLKQVFSDLKPYNGWTWCVLTKEAAAFLINDPKAHRVYAAVCDSFAPEEAFFATALRNSYCSHRVRSECKMLSIQHRHWMVVTEEDRARMVASGAWFVRRVALPLSQEFALNQIVSFASQRDESTRNWAMSVRGARGKSRRSIAWILPQMLSRPAKIRNLTAESEAQVRFEGDGTLHFVGNNDHVRHGTWSLKADDEVLEINLPDVIQAEYKHVSYDGRVLILVPNLMVRQSDIEKMQIVEIELSSRSSSGDVIEQYSLRELSNGAEAIWESIFELAPQMSSWLPASELLPSVNWKHETSAFTGSESEYLPGGIVQRHDEAISVELDKCHLSPDGVMATFRKASASQQREEQKTIRITVADLLRGHWRLQDRLDDHPLRFRFLEDGQIETLSGSASGRWFLADSTLIVLGIERYSVLVIKDYVWNSNNMEIIARAWSDIRSEAYVVLKQV